MLTEAVEQSVAVHNVWYEPASIMIRSGVAQAAAGLRTEVTVPPLRDEKAPISVVFHQTLLNGYGPQ